MEPAEGFRVKMVKEMYDVIALKFMKENGNLSGYEFIRWVQRKYGVLLSSGTVYSKLYSLERKGLVKGKQGERKRVYMLTRKGRAYLDTLLADPTTEQFMLLLEKRSA
ncbi:MAG: PadR family transcriptional regulator [Candidatus Freyarchaeota archaeon]